MARRPRIPKLPETRYPSNTGRTVPEAARREVYAMFRAEAEGVLGVLKDIVYNHEMDPGHRIAAGKEILNRGLGTAPNVEIVEKTLKIEHVVNGDAVRQMPDAELRTLMSSLTKLMTGPDAEDAEIIEHKP